MEKIPSTVFINDKITGTQIKIHTSYPDRVLELLSECVENMKLGLVDNK